MVEVIDFVHRAVYSCGIAWPGDGTVYSVVFDMSPAEAGLGCVISVTVKTNFVAVVY